MRIAYDYGSGPHITGMHPRMPGEKTETEQVLVISLDEGAKANRPGTDRRVSGGKRGALPVPGSDYELTVSDSAKLRDSEVRAHEQAHLFALGTAADSGIVLHTRTGPDGRSYAVGGSVKADLSPVPGDPRATLAKAKQVIRAAMAPGDPSAADLRVASDAYRLAMKAKDDLRESEWFA